MAESLFNPSSIYSNLKQQNLLPQQSADYSLGSNSGTYLPDRNLLFAPDATDQENKNTLAHEMSHAAQHSLLLPAAKKIAKKTDKTPQEQRFLDAFRKLLPSLKSGAKVSDRKQATKEQDKLTEALFKNKAPKDAYNTYRTQPQELQSFGVGNMSQKGQPTNQLNNLHLDPTMASEFSLLMNLYENLGAPLKEEATKQRQTDIAKASAKPGRYADIPFSTVYVDPFRDTTKD
tara:strand:+ start:47 stop:742 length:696 start_codon:yes stop_codon:yes gene_type:complete